MKAKLLMRWNIREDSEVEYFEFLINDFIPGMNKLGLRNIEVWFTAYGDCEQKMASGMMETAVSMQSLVAANKWGHLTDALTEFVYDYDEKIIPATQGFQL